MTTFLELHRPLPAKLSITPSKLLNLIANRSHDLLAIHFTESLLMGPSWGLGFEFDLVLSLFLESLLREVNRRDS